MRFDRRALLAPMAALLLTIAVPMSVLADHCGGAATITPASGRPGTTFVFRTNLGAASDLRVYRNEDLVREVFLEGDGYVRYDIKTAAGDAGSWRARAEVRGQTECAAEVSFIVSGTPETSTSDPPISPTAPAGLVALAAGVAAFGLAIRRLSRPIR